jgi:hypothetical protein
LAVGGALLLLATMAATAQAASGEFDYDSQDGNSYVLTDPENDTCLTFAGGGATHASNGTDATAFMYVDDSCTEPAFEESVGPGGIWDQTTPPPAPALSVRFGSSG